jgi:hypothetical protein
MSFGLLFYACTEIDKEPINSDLTNLKSDQITSRFGTNLIQLEATVTDSYGESKTTNEQSRGAASDRARFNIELRFIVEPTERQREVFQTAVDRWERIIIGDEENFTGVLLPSAYPGQPPLVTENEVLDDIIIEVNLTEIDGPGRILGRAGPWFIRETAPIFTTLTGVMEFDVADLDLLEARNQFEAVILHEMGHVFGIGTLWRLKDWGRNTNNLIDLSTLEQLIDPDYLGSTGNLFWKTEGGEGLLPVEGLFFDSNGNPFNRQGTSFFHWDEDRLSNELMTGFINRGVENPLSRITAGSLRDLGYKTANVGERYELPVQPVTSRTLRTSEDGLNIGEMEELIAPIGAVSVKRK